MNRIIVVLLLLGIGLPARAEPMKEFVTSATYGVLAGTLVGAATLAFTDKPGDNLNNIARGASLGLYAGILLGLYVVYGVPSGNEPEGYQDYQEGVPPEYQEAPPAEYQDPQVRLDSIAPIINQNGLDGVYAQATVFSF